MDIKHAIEARQSIRFFLPRPVERGTIEALLTTALRAPSAMNTQPWHITVVTGQVLAALSQENVEQALAGVPFDFDPPYPPEYTQRKITLGRALFTHMGIQRGDKEARSAWNLRGFRYFDAPAAIILSMERALFGTWGPMDMGGLAQTICLAAMEHGLGTCLEAQGVFYADSVRRHTGLTEAYVPLVAIALGYPDPEAHHNKFYADRAPLDEVADWLGF